MKVEAIVRDFFVPLTRAPTCENRGVKVEAIVRRAYHLCLQYGHPSESRGVRVEAIVRSQPDSVPTVP